MPSEAPGGKRCNRPRTKKGKCMPGARETALETRATVTVREAVAEKDMAAGTDTGTKAGNETVC